MDTPLIGNPANNYRFFYCAGGSVILSLILLLVITSYSAFIATDINNLMKEMNDVLSGVKTLLPEAKFGADMLGLLCNDGNFTRAYPNVRSLCLSRN